MNSVTGETTSTLYRSRNKSGTRLWREGRKICDK